MSINPGTTYKFKVEARNVIGYGAISTYIEILASTIPNKPATPSTGPALAETNLIVNWDPLADFTAEIGSAITSYKIYIQTSVLSFAEEITYCDGTDATIVLDTECSIPVSVLLLPPYNMVDGTPVNVKITATNILGESAESDIGGGAVIFIPLIPDAPVNLINNGDLTNKVRASFTWQNGADDGGKPVLDYRVSYDQGGIDWVVLTSTLST